MMYSTIVTRPAGLGGAFDIVRDATVHVLAARDAARRVTAGHGSHGAFTRVHRGFRSCMRSCCFMFVEKWRLARCEPNHRIGIPVR
jgi:hypothetical protein